MTEYLSIVVLLVFAVAAFALVPLFETFFRQR